MTVNPNSKIVKLKLAILTLFLTTQVKAAGVTSGDTLLEPMSARASAMGEAFTAVSDDIAAFGYNPASLKTLSSGQISLMYEKGLADDSYGQFMIGSKGMGLSLGYYDGGSVTLFDGINEKTVTAKKDLTASLGYSVNLGNMSVGVAGKYISSELADSESATAFAGDIGLQMPITSTIRFGAAVQNMGTKMTYIDEGNDLPQIARAGLGISLLPSSYKTTLLLDAPYFIKEHEMRAAIGVETMVGPMAIRAGYRTGNELAAVTFGAGFMMSGMSIDYSYGLVQDLEDSHRVSFALRFGSSNPATRMITQVPSPVAEAMGDKPEVTFVQRQTLENQKRGTENTLGRVPYVIKSGDSLAKIARRMYGDQGMWKKIYMANKHLINTSKALEVGQQIVLP